MNNDLNGSPTLTRLEGKMSATLVCWVLGLGSLVAWNSLLTIGDYYYELFPRYHPARVLTLVYQPFALVTMVILAYKEAKIDTRKRNLAGFTLVFLSTFALLILDIATSVKGGIGNYIGICIIVAVFGVADAHITVLFLAISTFIEFLCIFLYTYVFPKLPIVKHFRSKAASEGSKTVVADLAAAGIQKQVDDEKEWHRLSTKQLLLKNIDYALDLYLTYVLTLSIFPGFLYENTGSHQLGSWYPIVLIAMYNVLNLISRCIPLIECLKIERRKDLMLAVLFRFLFIPAFYFAAKYGDQGWMIMLTSLLGLTNGYLTVCVFTAAPKGYKGPEQNALGNLLVVFLVGGIASGVALDWLWLIGNGSF